MLAFHNRFSKLSLYLFHQYKREPDRDVYRQEGDRQTGSVDNSHHRYTEAYKEGLIQNAYGRIGSRPPVETESRTDQVSRPRDTMTSLPVRPADPVSRPTPLTSGQHVGGSQSMGARDVSIIPGFKDSSRTTGKYSLSWLQFYY